MNTLIGTGVALITPFQSDGSIDHEALTNIVNFNIDNGIDYLVVLGTTAESATLSSSEKKAVIDTILEANDERVPVVLGIGGNNTMEVINTINTTNMEPFEAILSVSPYYNKPTQEGIYQHFKVVSEASPKPIILYNVPGRTASNMLPETVIRLANDCENIVAIKEAAGDVVQAMKLLKDKPGGFHVISGDDMITLPMVLAGGSGVISVIGEGFPKEFSSMVRLGLKGESEKAYKIHYALMEGIDLIFEEGNPAGIKAVFESLGLCQDVVRLPLVSASQGLKRKIEAFISKLNS